MARTVPFASVCLALLVLAGCNKQEPEVGRFVQPRMPTPEKDRMLAVLVTEKDKTWSFRLSGPETAVAAHKEKFDEFLKSVKFGEKPPLTWTVPKGWEERPGDDFRFATIKTNAEPKPLEVTIVPLPKEGGALLPNVNRWRGQLSQPEIDEGDLAHLTSLIEIDGRKGTLVSLEGKLSKKAKMPAAHPPTRPKEAPPARPNGKLKYDLPEGWAKVPPKNQIISEQFDIVDGKDKAEATIVILPPGAGGELANLQRWREQIKLPQAKGPEEILKDFVRIDTGMGQAGLVDLNNPKAPGNNRILGVIMPADGSTYFLKLFGPSELVGKHKARFEAFAKSMKLE